MMGNTLYETFQARHQRRQHPDLRGDVPRQVHGPQGVPQGQGSQQRRHFWKQGEMICSTS